MISIAERDIRSQILRSSDHTYATNEEGGQIPLAPAADCHWQWSVTLNITTYKLTTLFVYQYKNMMISYFVGGVLFYLIFMILYRIFLERRSTVYTRNNTPIAKGWIAHNTDVEAVARTFRTLVASRRMGDPTVSLIRSRGGHADSNRTMEASYKSGGATRVDVSALVGVIALETRDDGTTIVHVEPGVAQDELARFCLANGFVPQVVLEFPGITAGGALAGGGIESSSHAAGSFADTVEEVDVLTGTGEMLKNVSRTFHPRLFAALRTSYGSIGLVVRIGIRLERAHKFVHVTYVHAATLSDACDIMTNAASREHAPDFIDAVSLSLDSTIIVLGTSTDIPPRHVPTLSLRNVRADKWFFWHLAEIAAACPTITVSAAKNAASTSKEEILTLDDYLFRFDRGAFWMARPGLEWFFWKAAWSVPTSTSPRAGPAWLIRVFYSWLGTTRQLYRMLHALGDTTLARLFIVQDFVMPSKAAAVTFVSNTTSVAPVKIWPLWICPVRVVAPPVEGDVGFGFPIGGPATAAQTVGDADVKMWFNVGVYGVPNGDRAGKDAFDPVTVNINLERAATALGGRKMLYAQTFEDATEFWAQFNKQMYERARNEYGGAQSISGSPFARIDEKVLLGTARVNALRGITKVDFFSAAIILPTAQWYFSAWGELLIPRQFHAQLGIKHTGF
jgi:delta24-sterol reductase